jgi:Holliday junction resolvasome RuvABC endonuclease subunit
VRFIGLDPGGKDQFGWSVVEGEAALPIRVAASGVVSNADQAIGAVLNALGTNQKELGP